MLGILAVHFMMTGNSVTNENTEQYFYEVFGLYELLDYRCLIVLKFMSSAR